MSKTMSERELSKWLNKMRLFWVLHGGIKNWKNDSVNPCDHCPHGHASAGGYKCPPDRLGVRPDLKYIYLCVNGTLFNEVRWCAEWIKHV